MKRSVFERKYAGSFPNSRNLTAGTLKQKESNRAQLLDLSFLAYDLLRDASGGAGADTEAGKRELLAKLGFEPVPTRLARARDVPPLFGELLKGREGWEFDADGVVVKLNDVLLQAALGVTAHHPRGAIAFKFQGDLGLTTIDEVEWSVSRSAVITPVARVAPVFLSGARVSRSTLHNVKEFNKLALKRGDRVEVKRRGDVIPKVEANLGGGSEPFPVPVSCPSCGSPTLLASPQLFVAGARLARFADREQLLALVRHMKEISASAGLFSLTDTCNSAARKEGDIRYKEALTWKKGDGEARKAILERLGRLPLLRCRQPEISLLLVLDPDLPAALELLGLVAPLVEPERLELRLLPVGESRYEGAAMSPLFERLAAAGRAGRFWEEAGEAIPSPGTRRENGAWTESASQDWTELAYQLADDFLVCARPESCPEVILSTLEHFVQTLGVEGFGRKIIENLHRAGLLKEREDFFRLEPGTLVALERMGDVLAAKLVDRVQETRTLPLSLFLMSLGVDELARHASTILEKEYGSLERVLALTEADLMKHESIAFGIAHQVVHGLRRKRRQIERLRPHVRIAAPAPAAAPDRTLPFSGRSFVFTGKMKTMGRKEAQAMVQKLGGEIPDGVTVDLSFLVVGDEGSPLFGEGAKGSKLVKAEKYVAAGASLRIISETQFLEMLRESGWSG
jgi:NAD-dependent DNA ligase